MVPRGNAAPAERGRRDQEGEPSVAVPDSVVVASTVGSDGIRDTEHRGIGADTFLWLLGSVCAIHGAPFDAELARRQFAPPYADDELAQALAALGFDAPFVPDVPDVAPGQVAIAFLHASNGRGALPRTEARVIASAGLQLTQPVLVVASGADRILYFQANSQIPSSLPPDEFALRFAGQALKVRRRIEEPKLTDEDNAEAREQRQFGFRWFVPALLKHKRIWRDVLAASLVIQLLALGMPLMTQAIIDKVVVHRTESTLIALGVGLAIFTVFSALLTWLRQTLIMHTGTRVDAVLGSAVFNHLVALPPRYFQQRPTGVIAARMHGVEQIREFLASAAVSLILDVPFLSICLALMFVYSLSLTLVALGILTLIVIASLVVSPIFQAKLNAEFQLGARNQAFLTEYVAGMDTVKSLQMEPILQRRYGDYLATYLSANFSTKQVANAYHVVASTLEQAMTLLILVVGAYIVMQPPADATQVFTIGMLVAFQMFAGKLSQPIMRLVGLWQQFQQARLAVARLGDLMNAPAEPYSVTPSRAGSAAPDCAERPLIDIQGLAFRYGDDRPFLYEDLDLHIRDGECVALMGPSGCGKSTLAKLLQGFYLPTRGRIVIDGIDSRNLAANELRTWFGVVPQDTVLFSGTVLDNLRLADPHASFEDVVHACRMAEIHDVVEQLPKGYETEIGERGAGLSGGQKQRIAIARALLKKPRVLIFDEATSNLDQQTAEAFARTIESLRGAVTILFITHARVGALKFDRVVHLGGERSPAASQPTIAQVSPLSRVKP